MEILIVLGFFILCANIISFFVGINVALRITSKTLNLLLTDEYLNKVMERTLEKIIKET